MKSPENCKGFAGRRLAEHRLGLVGVEDFALILLDQVVVVLLPAEGRGVTPLRAVLSRQLFGGGAQVIPGPVGRRILDAGGIEKTLL